MPVIKVENLSKKYILSHQNQERYTALRDVMTNGVKNLGKKLLSPFTFNRAQKLNFPFTSSQEDFYALQDVSFEIKQGDRVGIIGRNGAGKSTLLKILSRITEPTSGRIEITGRVASLLEVGTGFHPELTGRENIYLNGAILGMGRVEIKRKFDEIVDFAEVEKFLDTPVKRYSSGMYVRLAFAVAAHLEPEILIVDEVLAVGDAQFQKKCLGKMEEVGKQGRTVLFVSHNMGAIRALCTSGMYLKEGLMVYQGAIESVIGAYTDINRDNNNCYRTEFTSVNPYIKKVSISADDNTSDNDLYMNAIISIAFFIETHNVPDVVLSIVIRNKQDVWVHHTSDEFAEDADYSKRMTRYCDIPKYALAEGTYFLDVYLGRRNHELFQEIKDVIIFDVNFAGKLADKTTGNDWRGMCGPGLLFWH